MHLEGAKKKSIKREDPDEPGKGGKEKPSEPGRSARKRSAEDGSAKEKMVTQVNTPEGPPSVL